MEQKENKVNSNPKKRLSQSSSSLFAKPLLKPVPRADIAKKSTTTSKANSKPALATPTSVATTENGFKTPFKPVQSRIKATSSTTDLGNIKAKIQEEMAALDIEKPLLDPITKKAPTNFKGTFNFDPTCVTGIPLIQPKKTTVPKPFTFASDKLAAKRAIPK
ncbi:hypothetical protein TYRP_014329 [Tyrophagus putrescentiae]|nr:hypothetical protein TYRP_014329 [Tyrophagus putrescentiae]